MAMDTMARLLEKRRDALVEYCIGHIGKNDPTSPYMFVETPEDLFELLRMDPLDNDPVKSSWVAEAIGCAQQFTNAAYKKLERGYTDTEFDKRDVKTWELYNNYSDWAALQMIAVYPENYMNPFVRQRKTSLFKTLENNLSQTRLHSDTVQVALRDYLQTFEQTCDLDVISSYMDLIGSTTEVVSPARADYYFVGRQRVPPFQYFWRKAEVELTDECRAINPAAWSEWRPVEIPAGVKVLDIRPVLWNSRLCLVWAQWQDEMKMADKEVSLPHQLSINLSFMSQNGQWSAPLSLHTSEQETDHSEGARLIATVWADRYNPKGKLGVMLINDRTAPDSFKVSAVRDVLFRRLDWDDGGWLEKAATERFTTLDTVQHQLRNQPTVVSSATVMGNVTDFLDLQAVVFRVDEKDVLFLQGYCRPTGSTAGDDSFTLEVLEPATGDPKPIIGNFPLAGGWSTGWLELTRDKGSWPPATFSFGTAGERRVFVVTVANVTPFVPPTLLKNTADAAQFLSLNQDELKLKFTRLNSLFGPELVQRANISVDAVLDWSTQFLSEPPPQSGTIDEPNGAFDGANGLFHWELFFHSVLFVAARLRDEDRFQEALNWLHYLFDPQAPADPADSELPDRKPAYWRCRPLDGDGNLGCETEAPTDPYAIGYSAPRHFQILVFTEYVKTLMEWGDWYYRQLTRDSLLSAKLCYVQAQSLMGKPPSVRTVNRWEADTLGNLLNRSRARPTLVQFEHDLAFNLEDLPAAAEAAPLLGLLAVEPFKQPINEQLLALYDLPGKRLHNLRNNLTLDGKPLNIPLFSPPTDPNQLLRDLAAGPGGPRPMGGRLVVGAFRWRVSYEAALRAVQTLQDYGGQLLRFLEQRDRAEQEEIQQSHLVELGAYAKTVQEQTIAQLQASQVALAHSRTVAQERAIAYAGRFEENVSDIEYEVMESLRDAKIVALTSTSVKIAGSIVAAFPNIFGVANGGHRVDRGFDAVCYGLDIASSVLSMDADRKATTEGYRRRREEWRLQRDQALAEVNAIEAQITAQSVAVQAAQTSLEQTLLANNQALSVYNFLKKRATNAELFNWLLGQLKTLHYQAYDAVVSLCLSAQASLSAETGDYDSQIPLPQVWLDNRHGLTAGEHLRGYLLRMEREYLQRHERRLELEKAISLRRLFEDKSDPQPGIGSWASALQELSTRGTLEFDLTQLLFDRDYPGHYCRQISSVEVDLPALVGPFENVRATLLQISSMTATKATTSSVSYLHHPVDAVAPPDVLVNLRSGQQIALSTGVADNGMTAMRPDEGLLNCFESTGVVSRWQVKFPWPTTEPQAGMLASVTDIILRVRYTAKAGEPTFTRAVEDLVTRALTGQRKASRAGADHHE
ncbi:Tc toxin subunit A-related protein [Pseudomonas retamae]|uniref:Neuraminidase-like domain-containing protein n=1 Tax=Pseudomonas retamae TaxID=702110 RepID=A0ABW7DII0_9PSED